MNDTFADIPDLDIFFRGKKYNTVKDNKELSRIFNSDIHSKTDLITNLAMALLAKENEDKKKWLTPTKIK